MPYSAEQPDVGMVADPAYRYGAQAPFHPHEQYPEYPFARADLDSSNTAYAAVRTALQSLGLDAAHVGTSSWNPFGEMVKPGDRVVLKPNAVLDHNEAAGESVFASITHPSVLRAVADYCFVALGGKGELVLADAPLMSSDFAAWKRVMQLDALQAFYAERGLTLRVLDLRETTVRWMLGFTPSLFRRTERRDPAGYTNVDLGSRSMLAELEPERLSRAYGADYRVGETIRFHSGGHHIYRVSNTVLGADVLVTVPKLKLHQKVGVTLSIKGMVGIIGDKNTIVHHRRGAVRDGGDEYPTTLPRTQAFFHAWRTRSITSIAARQTLGWDAVFFGSEVVRRGLETIAVRTGRHDRLGGGSWAGNDTAWRMGADLMRIALYARPGVSELGRERRRLFVLVDGIIGGDRHGPLAPRARHVGAIVAGVNPVAVDWAASRLINVDPRKVKLLASCRAATDLSWTGSELPIIRSPDARLRDLWTGAFHLNFEAPVGWRGEIEAVA